MYFNLLHARKSPNKNPEFSMSPLNVNGYHYRIVRTIVCACGRPNRKRYLYTNRPILNVKHGKQFGCVLHTHTHTLNCNRVCVKIGGLAIFNYFRSKCAHKTAISKIQMSTRRVLFEIFSIKHDS